MFCVLIADRSVPLDTRLSRKTEVAKRFTLHPKHPERICWGCDKYCATDALMCGNGSSRTMHPAELIGEDWYLHGDWGFDVNELKDSSAS